MSAPEVSFCIPVYNAAARIERCLRGVLAQQAPSREILVVDNCSTDDTAARARRLLAGIADARVVINEKNLGRMENANRCLELAAGRYVKFALVNDVLLPGSTEMLLRAARAHPDATMICSRQRDVEAMPEVFEPVPPNPPTTVLDERSALLHLSREGNDTGGGGGQLFQAEAIRRNGLRYRPEIPFCADFHFAIELADCGPVVYLDAESYLFDRSVKGRYAQTGFKNYNAEAAVCARALGARLAKYGVPSWQGFEFLCRQYTGKMWNYFEPPLSPRGTLALFAGAGPYRRQAYGFALRHRARQIWQRCVHLCQRAASQVGLYHYPWERK